MTSNDAAAAPEPKPDESKRRRRFIGFSEQVENKRKDRTRRNKPRPWIERKFVVALVIGIAVYAWYVYIGRFCVPMIRRRAGAMGGRSMGVAFLVIFCVLGLMFWWTYLKLVLTPPGFARDYVPKTPAPQSNTRRSHGRSPPSASRSHDHDSDSGLWDSGDENICGTPYAEISRPSLPTTGDGASQASHSHSHTRDPEKDAGIRVHAAPRWSNSSVAHSSSPPRRKASTNSRHTKQMASNSQEPHADSSGVVPPVASTSAHPHPFDNPKLTPLPPKTLPALSVNRTDAYRQRTDDGLPPPLYSRRPPTHPALLPEYRYCFKDELVKPMRTHHCRVCATCVLMFDHHCPWIGQCVGAHNHKFFVNFLQWSSPWTLWIFATLVAMNAKKDSNPAVDIDPQHIVIIALSALFSLFTVILLIAHVRFIILNQSSVESLFVSGMRERERAIMGKMVPLCDWRRTNVHRKRKQIRTEWDYEWGKLGTEGNLWWLETVRTNWEHRMGKNRWGWFLPVGKSEGDGLTYPTNPRFDTDGRWRRRNEWPPELR